MSDSSGKIVGLYGPRESGTSGRRVAQIFGSGTPTFRFGGDITHEWSKRILSAYNVPLDAALRDLRADLGQFSKALNGESVASIMGEVNQFLRDRWPAVQRLDTMRLVREAAGTNRVVIVIDLHHPSHFEALRQLGGRVLGLTRLATATSHPHMAECDELVDTSGMLAFDADMVIRSRAFRPGELVERRKLAGGRTVEVQSRRVGCRS